MTSEAWAPVDLSAPEYDRPTEPPIVCGLIYGGGKRHAISGPPEAAKTLAALIFGLEHYRAGHGRFALVDFEMGEHATRSLLSDLGATLEEIASVYYVAPEGPPTELDLDNMTAYGVKLAIIDAAAGAYDVSGLDDMKRKDAEEWARTWVRPLWKRYVSTLLLDHVVKKSNQRGKFSIGTERKLGAVDVHLGLEAVKQLHRGADGLITFTTHKDRPAHLARPRAAELELHSDPRTHAITWTFRAATAKTTADEDGFRPTVLMERVSKWLERRTEPVTRSSIAKSTAVPGKREYVLLAVDLLVAEGYAAAVDTTGGKMISHLLPFHDVPDVPEAFLDVPENAYREGVPAFPPPQGVNGNGNVPHEAEQERLPVEHVPAHIYDDDIPF